MDQQSINFFRFKKLGLEFIYCNNSHINYPEHNHTSIFTIGLILSGELSVHKQNKKQTYTQDTSFTISPYETHSITANINYELLSICINKTFIKQHNLKTACTILKKITCSLVDKDIFFSQNLSTLLNALKFIYNNQFDEQSINQKYLTIAQNYSQQPDKTLKLVNIAEKLHTSKFHFIREFKKSIGLTPHKFQLQKRVRLAQNLLEEKTCLTDVALASGFYDQSHFIRHFKNFVGLTPTNYLLSLQKSNIMLEKI